MLGRLIFFLGRSEGESIPFFSPGLWWLPAVLDVPWLMDASLQSLLLSSHHLPFCVLLSSLLYLIKKSDIGFTLITSAKILFPRAVGNVGWGFRRKLVWLAVT